MDAHKFYIFTLKIMINWQKTYSAEISISASSMKSPELPEVDPRGFSVPLTKVNENASPSLISFPRPLGGALHFPVQPRSGQSR